MAWSGALEELEAEDNDRAWGQNELVIRGLPVNREERKRLEKTGVTRKLGRGLED